MISHMEEKIFNAQDDAYFSLAHLSIKFNALPSPFPFIAQQ